MVVAEDLQCLKAIALLGGCRGAVWVSSQTLGASLDISPQTASRRLISLERQMLITRSLRADGQHIAVTEQGEAELRREFSEYCRIFGKTREQRYVLAGTVITGLGEGRYYMSLPQYCGQFMQLCGFEPYAGTLNIRLNPPSIQIRKKLENLEWTVIRGFFADDRTFGDVRCLPCRIGGSRCAIVVPGRTHYPDDIIEVISPDCLRDKLGLNDGDSVEVEVI